MRALPHIFIRCPSCVLEFRTAAWRVVPGSELRCTHCGHGWTICADLHAGPILTAQRACANFDGRRDSLRQPWQSPGPHQSAAPDQIAADLRAILNKMRRADQDRDIDAPQPKAATKS